MDKMTSDNTIVGDFPTYLTMLQYTIAHTCKERYQYEELLYLFIKALQHKCWRSVGHLVLQPV